MVWGERADATHSCVLPHINTTAGGEFSFTSSLRYGHNEAASEVFHDGRPRPPLSGGGISPGLKGTQEGRRCAQ